MGKAAREARKLAEQAKLATDLNALKSRPLLLAGLEAMPVGIVTQYGPTIGAQLTFHMQNGDTHGPIILDAITAMTVIAAITTTLTQGRPGPEPPGPAEAQPTSGEPPTLDNQTPSGIIIP